MNYSCDTVSAAGDGLGRVCVGGGGGVIRAASGIYITQCQRTMATGRDTGRKSDGQERFLRALAGITIHLIHAALFRALFSRPEKLDKSGTGRRRASKKELAN